VAFFNKIGRFSYRYRWFVLAVWAALLVAGAFFAPNLAGRLHGGGFAGANTEAERVQDVMVEEFGFSPTSLTVVFTSDGIRARSTEFQRAEQQALKGVGDIQGVSSVRTYRDTQSPEFISQDGHKSYAVIGFDVTADRATDMVDTVRKEISSQELETYVTGAPAVYLDIQQASNEDVKKAEKYAFPLALIILVLAFGSLVAAGVPVAVGGAGVVTSLTALYFLAGAYEMSVFSMTIATMLALGLGIDYALFAVSRFREELEDYPPEEAVHRTVSTAGRSIFFSGTAVLIGLSGLLFFPYMFMRSIGVAGVVVVLISVISALTLLPAILGVLGYRVNSLSLRRRGGGIASASGFWAHSARAVMRHPFLVLLATGAVLFTLLYPTTYMRLGLPEASVLPDKYESRIGDDILKQSFDYSSLNPMEGVATLNSEPLSKQGLTATKRLGERLENKQGVEDVQSLYTAGASIARDYAENVSQQRQSALDEAQQRAQEAANQRISELRSRYGSVSQQTEEKIRQKTQEQARQRVEEEVPSIPEGVSVEGEVTPAGVVKVLQREEVRSSEDVQELLDSYVAGDSTLLHATPVPSPYSEQAREVVGSVRSVQPPDGVESFMVGGISAGQKDFISGLYSKAPYAAAFVLLVTYAVLCFTFRSVFIPLKAVIVNILSLTASFGSMVWVFQEGHLSGLLNFTPLGYVAATLPILMFSTVFGVSMDYEVFLLSRIREAYERGETNPESVAEGLTRTAGIITSAAAIIIVVTGAFAFTGIIITKAVGLGLAVAVLVDASIIRILAVPATMRVLGDWNWWPGNRQKVFSRKPYK
jgi:RND superfamily putative drug exporter